MIRRIEIRGGSMEPTLRPGQRVWAERLTYRFRRPRRGDVVVAVHPHGGLHVVKRVRAGPGESVDGRILGPDEYYVAGDNDAASTGSETFGPLSRPSILARVLRLWSRR